MSIKKLLIGFATTFVITLIAHLAVVYFWSLIIHAQGVFDWETSFCFALVIGIVLPIARAITE